MNYTPKNELDSRLKKLQEKMQDKGVEGALIVQSADLFYLSGTTQNGILYVPAGGNPLLMVKKSYNRAREESKLENIVPLLSIKKMPEMLAGAGLKIPAVLGVEMDVLPASSYLFYKKIFSNSDIVDISALIREIRQIKSEYELDLIRLSGRKISEVFSEIPGMIREGMSELELAATLEFKARAAGHIGNVALRAFGQPPFMGHLISGANAAMPSAFDGPNGGPGVTPAYPHGCGLKAIMRGEPILADYAGVWEGYIADLTRFFAIGKISDKMNHAFETALEIQAAVVERMVPGANGSELHQLALDIADKAGLGEYFMGYGNDRARFLGHGVGLELDEWPVLAKGLDTSLQKGMVIAIEPKFMFPGEGAVGIENTFALTATGLEKLTTVSDEIQIIAE